MKRKTMYYVGGETEKYNEMEWNLLKKALGQFNRAFPDTHPCVYRCGLFGTEYSLNTFAVSKSDHKSFTKWEIEALYWYYRGVLTQLLHRDDPRDPPHLLG